MSRPALLFYCQHSLGLGHLARALRLADGLTERFDVHLLNGGRFPPGTAVPTGITVINLPPLGHDEDGHLVSHDPSLTVEEASGRRRDLILGALTRVRPRAVVIEMYPFGRRKFEFELLPLLERAAAMGPERPLVVCSLRDILVHRRRKQAEYDERCGARANASFDAVLVHADPRFARLEESFAPRTPLQIPVHYTGFVAPPMPSGLAAEHDLDGQRERRLIVSAGGGMVGEPLFRAAVGAHREVADRLGLRTMIVAGPFLPEPALSWLRDQAVASPALEVVRQVDDLCGEIRRSAVSLSQAGYNTTMDLLRARTPAVVVPYGAPTEDEQLRRAERLAALGVLRVVRPEESDGPVLIDQLSLAATSPPPGLDLDLDGASRSAEIIAALVARGVPGTESMASVRDLGAAPTEGRLAGVEAR